MNVNLETVPRKLLWTAAGIAVVALVTIIVVQILTVVLLTRPPLLTRWLTGIFVICSQAIFASIALGISGYALHATTGHRTMVARPAVESTTAKSEPFVNPLLRKPVVEDEPKLPAALRSALAAADATPETKRKRGE